MDYQKTLCEQSKDDLRLSQKVNSLQGTLEKAESEI